MTKVRTFLALLLLACSLVVPATCVWAFFNFLGPVSDFPQYYCAAKMAMSGNAAAVYDLSQLGAVQHEFFPAMKDRIVGFYIPPPGLLFVMPLALFSPAPAAAIWMIGLLACLIAAVLLIGRLFPRSPRYACVTAALVMLSGPLYEALRLGQPAPVFLLGLAGSIYGWKSDKPFIAAVSLLAFAAKPHLLAPFIVILLAAGKLRTVLLSIGMIAAVVLFSLIAFGIPTFESYLHGLTEGMKLSSSSIAGAMAADINPTVRGQLLRLQLPQSAVMAVSVIATLAALVLIYLVGRRIEGRRIEVQTPGNGSSIATLLALGLPLGAVSALHFHEYDLILLLPALVACDQIGPLSKRTKTVLMTSRFLFVLAYILPVFLFLHYKWLLQWILPVNILFLALAVFAAGCMLAAAERANDLKRV